MDIFWRSVLAIVMALALWVGGAQAQSLSYPGCPDVTAKDFVKVPLVTRSTHGIAEPIEMVVTQDGRILFVERLGKIRMWTPATKATVDLIKLPALTQSENGVTGIALDPEFDSNSWVYLYWGVDANKSWRVSRFTLKGNSLPANTEKILLEIPLDHTGCCHTGGSMTFDFHGNLWVSTGNATSNASGKSVEGDRKASTNYVNEADFKGDDQRGSANTNSLLGKILRIKPKPIPDAQTAPKPGPGQTYDIPEGNLFPVGQYPAGKTRPEIYTMGHRNPYTISVDPYRNWLMWGDIGPDEHPQGLGGILTEEHNLVTKPGFMGWPYFVGDNQWYRLDSQDPKSPKNRSKNNTGLVDLPPAQPAIRSYAKSSALAGPIYYYDGANPSKTKLPPHFNKKWIIGNFRPGWVRVLSVNEAGNKIDKEVNFWPDNFLNNPLDLEVGPDGNLYAVEYSGWFTATSTTAITRIEYRGNCLPATPLLPENPVVALRDKARNVGGANTLKMVLGGSGFGSDFQVFPPSGTRSVQVFDLRGVLHWESRSDAGWAQGLVIPSRDWRPGIYPIRYLP